MRALDVLIIDDNESTRDLLRTLLEFEGHSVCCCENGVSGLDLMKERRFEIIITDYLMPMMKGDEVTRQARRFCPDSFIIGCSIDARALQFANAGADTFLNKEHILQQLPPLIREREAHGEGTCARAFLSYPRKNKIFMEKHDIMGSRSSSDCPPRDAFNPRSHWLQEPSVAFGSAKESSMLTQKPSRRPFGQILVDGGFLTTSDLGRALEEQKQSNELLGQVLVRMGVLEATDINAVLAVQERLDDINGAVKIAAGVRQMLGALLLQAGHITEEELGQALGEQQRTGGKLGEILVRRGLLTEQQLDRLLDFQRNQQTSKPASNPLRLGEILISSGYITRQQLDAALLKQTRSGKKLGEVLVEEGYVKPQHITHAIRVQHMLMTSVLVAVLSLGTLTACGSGGGQTGAVATGESTTAAAAAVSPSNAGEAAQNTTDNFTVSYDEYGLLKANFFYSTCNDSFWSIQADIAENVWDPNFKTVLRIDIQKPAAGDMPVVGGKTFAIEDNAQYEKFPGSFLVFNGQQSTLRKVESGTISFSQDSTLSGDVSGSYDVMLTDYDSTISPTPHYHLMGTFSFKVGTYNSAPAAAS